MTLDQARRDYESDPMFRQVVDCIEYWIYRAQVSPAEARMAAMLAALRFEERQTVRYVYPAGYVNMPRGMA